MCRHKINAVEISMTLKSWAEEFIVEPEWFPNEGDRQAWRERKAALLSSLARPEERPMPRLMDYAKGLGPEARAEFINEISETIAFYRRGMNNCEHDFTGRNAIARGDYIPGGARICSKCGMPENAQTPPQRESQ